MSGRRGLGLVAGVMISASTMVMGGGTVGAVSAGDEAFERAPREPEVASPRTAPLDGAGVRGQDLHTAVLDPHLDTTWSGDGIAGLTGNEYTVALSPQDSGRLYVASFNESDAGAMRLTRFEANGSLATSFGGGDGVLQRRFAPSTNAISFPTHIIRTGDKFVVVGDHYDGRERLGVARLTTAGSYDTSFSSDGRVLYRVFPREHDLIEPWKVRVLSNGKIAIALAAFDVDAFGDYVFAEQALIRLTATGGLDPTFSGDGVAIVSDDTTDVTFLSNGGAFAGRFLSSSLHQIRKLLPSSAADTTFSGDAQTTVDCGLGHVGVQLDVDATGRLMGSCVRITDSDDVEFRLFRLTTTGPPDTTYSGDGTVTVVADDFDIAAGGFIHIAPTGIASLLGRSEAFPNKMDLYVIGADGEPDLSWGPAGFAQIDVGFLVEFNQMAVGGGRTWVALQKSSTVTALVALIPPPA